MPKVSRHAVAAAAPGRGALRIALSATALLSLVLLLLAPRLAHAAPAARDADVTGRWIADKNQPDMDYTVKAGPAGKVIVEVPAKAFNRPKGESVTLAPDGPGRFATPKGGPVRASFTVTGPRNAEFKLWVNRPDTFHVTDQLLSRP